MRWERERALKYLVRVPEVPIYLLATVMVPLPSRGGLYSLPGKEKAN